MNPLKVLIGAQDVSDAFWRGLLLRRQAWARHWLTVGDVVASDGELLRAQADYNTGSVPTATVTALALLVAELRPERVAEIGTFIGNSTRALASAGAAVHTCDKDNDIPLNRPSITQYPKQTSTQMLEKLNNTFVDLFFFDGRVQEADLPHIARLMHRDTVFALDDCYQTEKGNVNLHLLLPRLKNHFYLPPPRADWLVGLPIIGGTTLGLLVPVHSIQVNQA